ncbi:MAG: hypothetical protein JSV92_00320 [archaeon]|nr:MAG: hypothetical protein JSV92_00320 [archaeon]
MKRLLVLFFVIILFSGVALAHQPRIVSEDVTMIRNPEISQAFYGELKGRHDHYNIIEDQGFNLYVSILVPDLLGIGKDVSVGIEPIDDIDNNFIYFLNGSDFEWEHYYEEFGGDWYYGGPDVEAKLGPGGYDIHVMSPDNLGKYVLVVGKKEEFPLDEFLNTIVTLPRLKSEFFEKSPFEAYFNLIGVFLLVIILIIIALAYGVYRLLKKFRKSKKK